MHDILTDELVNEIHNYINEADKVLVGLGMEWNSLVNVKESFLNGDFENIKMSDLISKKDVMISDTSERIIAYQNLKKLLQEKDYYIISLCDDDVIYEIFDDNDNVVTPCGGYRFLQCGQHIMSRDEVVIKDGKPICPICGGNLSYNNIKNENYMEESYLSKFNDYKGWLQSTINKKLVILELGTDMRFPQVIRFAFDRLIKFNLKSKMYRVNKSLYMVDSSAEGRGIAVKCDSLELVKKM